MIPPNFADHRSAAVTTEAFDQIWPGPATEGPDSGQLDLNQYLAMHRRYSASMQSERNDPAFYLAKAAEYCTKAAATTDVPVRDALAAVALEYIAKALRRDAQDTEKRNHRSNHRRNHDRKEKAPPKRG